MIRAVIIVIFLLVCAIGVAFFVQNNDKGIVGPSRVEFSSIRLPIKAGFFKDTSGNTVILNAELKHASTNDQRQNGLMTIGLMPFKSGMLFTWPTVQPRTFWMKNTPLELDLLFIKQGVVTAIEYGERYSLKPIGPVEADAVVEMHYGTADHYGIKVGMLFNYNDDVPENSEQ